MCCVGLSIDLLRVFSRELRFDYDLFEVEDGMWGAIDKVRAADTHENGTHLGQRVSASVLYRLN